MATPFYTWENEGVRDIFDFSKFILKNAKTVQEGYWLFVGPITGNMLYDTEKYSREMDSGNTCVQSD